MDRKAAVATALAVVLGIGAAAFAVQANLGIAGPRSEVGQLGQKDAAVVRATTKPRVITVYVTPIPVVKAPARVRYVDVNVPARSGSRANSTRSTRVSAHHEDDDRESEHEDGGERDD